MNIRKIVAETVGRFGKIDILVNNAGICHHENAETVSYENWRKVMDVNLDGLFFLSQAVGNVMIRQNASDGFRAAIVFYPGEMPNWLFRAIGRPYSVSSPVFPLNPCAKDDNFRRKDLAKPRVET